MQPNTYSIGDATDFVRDLKGIVSGVVTSPPYNKARRRKPVPSDNWKANKLFAEGYDGHDDNMPETEFIEWQREFLTACVETVGEKGVILYNIGRRIHDKVESLRTEIVSGFPVRQTIIWNRGSSNNQGGARPTIFPPIYELIYVIAGPEWRLPEKHLSDFRHWGDVWRIPPEIGTEHPAPFPVELARRMCMTANDSVADPFAGSGTVGIAASELGLDYYLNDKSDKYRQMFEKRLAAKNGGSFMVEE